MLAVGVPLLAVGVFVAFAYGYGRVHEQIYDWLQFDDPNIETAAAEACTQLVGVLESDHGGRIAAIRAGNEGIKGLVARMNALGHDTLAGDDPAVDWIADWDRLAAARDSFAAALDRGTIPTFVVPETRDGYPITTRMTNAAPPECTRAIELAAAP